MTSCTLSWVCGSGTDRNMKGSNVIESFLQSGHTTRDLSWPWHMSTMIDCNQRNEEQNTTQVSARIEDDVRCRLSDLVAEQVAVPRLLGDGLVGAALAVDRLCRRLLLDEVQVLVQAVEQEREQLRRVVLLEAAEARLELANDLLERARRNRAVLAAPNLGEQITVGISNLHTTTAPAVRQDSPQNGDGTLPPQPSGLSRLIWARCFLSTK